MVASDSAVGMDLGGFGSGCGYGSLWLVMEFFFFFLFFLGLWCSNAMVVVVVVVVVAVDLWVVVGWWCCGVVIFFIILIDYCKIMIILIGPSVTLDFPLIW